MLIEVTAFLTIIWLLIMHRYLKPVRTITRARQGK